MSKNQIFEKILEIIIAQIPRRWGRNASGAGAGAPPRWRLGPGSVVARASRRVPGPGRRATSADVIYSGVSMRVNYTCIICCDVAVVQANAQMRQSS